MHGAAICVYKCPSIFSCQRSSDCKGRKSAFGDNSPTAHLRLLLLFRLLVGLGRLELPTSPLSGVRSNHLSYRPVVSHHWWSWSGSNRRPPECKSGALPAELQPLNPTEARYREPLQTQPVRASVVTFRGRLDAESGYQTPTLKNYENESREQNNIAWTGTAATYSAPCGAFP